VRNTEPTAVTPATIMELANQRQNWVAKRVSKLTVLIGSGISRWPAMLPVGLKAADITHTPGNSAKASASRTTR
jgi:hypothetical protein